MNDNRRIVFTADSRFELKTQEGKRPTLEGYALVWNVLSTDRGGYKVRLLPNSATFTTPTLAVFHHNFRDILGNTENQTLRIMPDAYGVKVEIDLPNTTAGHDAHELVKDKYVRGMSFAMVNKPEGEEVIEDGQKVFNASAYMVDEVTVTGVPAFTQTSISIKQQAEPPSFSNRIAQSIQMHRFKLDMHRLTGAKLP